MLVGGVCVVSTPFRASSLDASLLGKKYSCVGRVWLLIGGSEESITAEHFRLNPNNKFSNSFGVKNPP
jgi:hypothetical protein